MSNRKISIFIIFLFIMSFSITFFSGYISYPSGNSGDDTNILSKFKDNQLNEQEKLKKEGNNITENKIDDNYSLKNAFDAFFEGDLELSKHIYSLYLNKSVSDVSVNKDILLNLIYINELLGDYDSVLEYYRILLNKFPDNFSIKFEFAQTLSHLGNYSKSLEILMDLLNENLSYKTRRKKSLLYYYSGKALNNMNKLEKALNFLNKGISYDPELTLNYIEIAKIYEKEEEFLNANNYYKKALAKDNSYSILYPEIALNYEKIGHYEDAYYYWKQSQSSGIKTEKAEYRIDILEKEYPEFKPEPDAFKLKKAEIDWTPVDDLEVNDKSPLIKVGLMDNRKDISFKSDNIFNFIVEQNSIFQGQPETLYKIEYNDSIYSIYKNDQLLKTIKTSQPINVKTEDSGSFIVNVKFGQGYFWSGSENRQYRGDLKLKPVNNERLTLINIVNLEEYLISVVPSEMPAGWPLEALKSQAIAARSYALNNLNRHQDDGYNLCATVHCAVYSGINREDKRSTKAVLETEGEVAVYDGEIINAVFHSNSGGFTENSEDIWLSEYPYLRGVNNMKVENPPPFFEPYQVNNWIKDVPDSYSHNEYTGDNTYRWVSIIPAEYLIEKYDLVVLKNIIPLNKTKMGTIEKILIVGENEEIILEKDRIRSGLGGLRSNRFIINKIYNSKENRNIQELIIHGSGWGHKVGLDQTAAAGMAEAGYKYNQIISHFYQGTEIKNIYDKK